MFNYGSCFCRRSLLYPFLVLLVLCHILCSLKENVLGSPSLCKLSILGRFQCQFCFCDPSALSVLFSVLQFQKFLFWKYFLEEWPLVLTSYEICQGQCLYILCVLSFPIFQSIYLWRAFCYLVVFQMVIVGCWAVDVLLFQKLFLQVSLLVHFLEYP